MASDPAMALDPAKASEVVGDNMHIDSRVIKVADIKSVVIRPLRSFGGCHGL